MSRPSLVEEIFLAALEKRAVEERAAFLDGACRGDASLRNEVDRLLLAHPSAGRFLEPPAPDAAATADFASRDEKSGVIIAGRYKLLEPIGEGGMGSVWMAQQTEPVKRAVALKLIKEGMDTRAVLARFEAERQALALMDHPNIARVLDAGSTSDGRPFFVMELVKGVPITRYCDDRKLTLRQRLELFIPVCQAVQHAHQKGVIHRDLKPSNVLVAQYDDRPAPKVIDFGVAKAAGQPLTDHTLVTGFGAVVGTPEYMSPEQAQFNQLDIDTRSDVYALGVLLYELLTGSTPFTRKEFEKAGLLEILRVIREQEPPRPSTRLSTAEALPTLAANRGSEPKVLAGLLKNDLDWIVMKAMEKDRNRRYETATGFAADVQRYLAGEAVQAHPPSTAYRLKKFGRKHRVALFTAMAFVSLLIVAVVVTGVAAVIARQAELKAQANAEEADRMTAQYVKGLEANAQARYELEVRAAGLQTDLDLDELRENPTLGLLRLASSTKKKRPVEEYPIETTYAEPGTAKIRMSVNDDSKLRTLREFSTMAVLATGQRFAPLLPPITHDGLKTFNPDLNSTGQRLLTSGTDMTSRLWDTATNRPIAILRQGGEKVFDSGFSFEGDVAFTCAVDGVIRLWDARDGSFRREIKSRPDRIKVEGYELSNPVLSKLWPRMKPTIFLQNDKVLTRNLISCIVFGDGGGGGSVFDSENEYPVTAELWDAKTGQLIAQFKIPKSRDSGFEFFGNGRWIKALSAEGGFLIFSAEDGRLLAHLKPESRFIFYPADRIWHWRYQFILSPSGRTLAAFVVSDSKTYVQTWDTISWQPTSITGPTNLDSDSADPYKNKIIFIDETTFICGDEPNSAWGSSEGSVYQLGQPQPKATLPEFPRRLDGNRLLFRTGMIFDARSMQRLQPPKGRKYHPDIVRFAPDGRFLWENDVDGNPAIIDTLTEKHFSAYALDKYVPNVGWVSTSSDRLPPLDHLNIPPELLELWAQVAVRGELDEEGVFKKWNEETWEKKRQELALKPAPYADFPFPGYVAQDRLHWLRKEYEAASEAEQPRLARQLLDRAEAAGDANEAARWRAVLAPKVDPPAGAK